MTSTATAVPQGWRQTNLGELVDVIRGVSYSKADAREAPGPGLVPLLRATNIGDQLDFNDLVFVPESYVSDQQRLRAGDIVVAASSGSRSVVGKAAPLIQDWEGAFGAFCLVVRPKSGVSPRYVAYFMASAEYRQRVSALAAGVNINNLKRQHITDTPIRVAPRHEQERIVAEIEKQFTRLDAGVETLRRLQAHLRRYRAAVLKAACGGGGGESPGGWTAATLGELATLVTSGSRGWASYYADDGPVFIRAQDIKSDRLDLSAVAHVQLPKEKTEGARTRVCRNDLLITITGANVTKSARVDADIHEGYVSQHVGLVRLKDPAWAAYLHHWIISPGNGRAHLMRAAYGAGKPGLNLDNLRELPVMLPPAGTRDAVVAQIESQLSQTDAVTSTAAAAETRASRLRAAMLRAAFEGRLVTSEAPVRANVA